MGEDPGSWGPVEKPSERWDGFERLRVIVVWALACVALVALPEIVSAVLLESPRILGDKLLRVFRAYYMGHDRRIIQFLPECARYHPELTYILKPGHCRIRNREHTADYFVNSFGLRDDEPSLDGPQVIVLGDSQAMGWGVAQEETFAQLLEHASGQRVLNAAISSYGTVREMRLLDRLDTSRMRYLVVQYCQNDWLENQTYLENGNSLPITDRSSYDDIVSEHLSTTRYYPGKHVRTLVQIWRSLPPEVHPVKSSETRSEKEAVAFLNALLTAKVALDQVEIIVFEVNGWARNDKEFTSALARVSSERGDGGRPNLIRVLDLSAKLGGEKYFVLDDHLNAAGHRAVANELLPSIGGRRHASFPGAPMPRVVDHH